MPNKHLKDSHLAKENKGREIMLNVLENISFDDRDEFKRKDFANKVIKLLRSDIDVSPMVIDGDWGIGKTEFCRKLINLINAEHSDSLHAIYVDAFAEDYFDNPLISILSVLYEDKQSPEFYKSELFRNTAAAIGGIVKNIAPIAFTTFLGKEKAELLNETITGAVQGTQQQLISKLLRNRIEKAKYLKILHETISKVTDNKQIVLFIDELDRCRPDYALLMLETIKHIFNMENLQIVLVANLKQLVSVIRNVYTNDEDIAKQYLDKFIAQRMALPFTVNESTYGQEEIRASQKYFELILAEYPDLNNGFFKETKKLAMTLIADFKFSLRDVEKLIRLARVIQTINPLKDNIRLGWHWLNTFALFSVVRNRSWVSVVAQSPNYQSQEITSDIPVVGPENDFDQKNIIKNFLEKKQLTQTELELFSLFGEISLEDRLKEFRSIILAMLQYTKPL